MYKKITNFTCAGIMKKKRVTMSMVRVSVPGKYSVRVLHHLKSTHASQLRRYGEIVPLSNMN